MKTITHVISSCVKHSLHCAKNIASTHDEALQTISQYAYWTNTIGVPWASYRCVQSPYLHNK